MIRKKGNGREQGGASRGEKCSHKSAAISFKRLKLTGFISKMQQRRRGVIDEDAQGKGEAVRAGRQ